MKTFLILFRGINVGGNNRIPMKELVPLLEQSQCEDVFSYIQSGNIILNSQKNPYGLVNSIVSRHYEFSPDIFVFGASEFLTIASNNPYKEFEGKYVHFYICKNSISLNLSKIDKYIADSEDYTVKDNVFYLSAPNGIGRSKLVSNIESCLAQRATGRNLNTVNKITSILERY